MADEVEPTRIEQAVDAWLGAELKRAWLLAERTLRQYQTAKLRAPAAAPVMKEIEAALTERRTGFEIPADADLGRLLSRLDEELPALRAAAPLGRAAAALGMHPLELEVLVTVVMPHVDAVLGSLHAAVRGTPSRPGVDLALVAKLLRLGRAQRLALLDCLDPQRPLIGRRLIQINPYDVYGSSALRELRPEPDLLDLLLARADVPWTLQRTCRVLARPPTLDGLLLDDDVRVEAERMLGMAAHARGAGLHQLPWLVLTGPRGAGKRELAARVAAAAGGPLFVWDVAAAPREQVAELAQRAQREALVRGAVLYLGPIEDAVLAERGEELFRLHARHPSAVVIGVQATRPRPLRGLEGRPLFELLLPAPSEATRLGLWRASLEGAPAGGELDLPALARSFHLSPGEIAEIAGEAALTATAGERPLVHADLRAGIERRLRTDLGEVARQLAVTSRWEDLVLPPDDLDRLQEFIGRRLHASKVYGEWGYGERISHGRALIALLSGPPGTGKTMIAGLIAKAMGLDVYQVDLAQVVSKWVGETEKQLAKTFDHAERAHAVLLFDEADSLFAKRTEVKSSNDRYANLSVNYLLQRLETYTGVAVLTTNKDAALDEALQRRLTMHLRLRLPDPPERERLWRSFLPANAPIGDDLDLRGLAREFKLSGGYIKNAAVRAAFLAASRPGRKIDGPTLRLAATLELEEMGRVIQRKVDYADVGPGWGPDVGFARDDA